MTTLRPCTTRFGERELRRLAAGGVINDHHGVGIKLAPFMRPQWGAAFDQLERIKRALDPTTS